MPGTRKDKSLNWMPSRVYRGKSAFEWHPAGGGSVRLCALDATPAQVWTAFEAAEAAHGKRPKYTVGDLSREYFASRTFLRRRPRTQQDYQDCWKVLGRVFEDADARLIQPKHVREYMDTRGKSSEVRANREKAVLHNIFAHAFERSIVKQNPCIGVKSFPEKARDRYIEDAEYNDFLEHSPQALQIFMEIAYLTAARCQDVRAIMLGDLRKEGIYIQQQKTGKKQIKEWTPRLRAAVDMAMARRAEILSKLGRVDCLYLILTERGMPYSESGFKTAWARNRAAIEEETKEKIGWTFHDIKAKSISDHEGDKQQFSGHKTRGQVESYNRKTEVVPSLLRPGVRK